MILTAVFLYSLRTLIYGKWTPSLHFICSAQCMCPTLNYGITYQRMSRQPSAHVMKYVLNCVFLTRDTRQELADCQYLPGDVETVENVLSKEMVERIEAYFQSIKQLFSKWLPSGSSLLGGTNR